MAEGTRDYKRLEGMFKDLKDCDQKREKDLARMDAALEDIKVMINGLTLQYNDLRGQRSNQGEGTQRESILGEPRGISGESSGPLLNEHAFKYTAKLEFPKFDGEGIEEWLFKVEHFFMLDKTLDHSKISVVALHLEGCALHWHKNFLKLKARVPNWEEYVRALRCRFGSLAYDDPMAELKKLKQTSTL